MPISGGKYVAPTWTNGAAPAINAAELQAVCNTLESVQTRAKVQVVSYTGTGQYGSSHPCSITFTDAPDFVIFVGGTGSPSYWSQPSITETGGTGVTVYWVATACLTNSYQDMGFLMKSPGPAASSYTRLSNNGKTIQWYVDATGSAEEQFNYSGITYYFLGISGVTTP